MGAVEDGDGVDARVRGEVEIVRGVANHDGLPRFHARSIQECQQHAGIGLGESLVGAARGLIWPASLGALCAFAVVLSAGLILQRPLARVPENALKFTVGVMLSAFGVFWTGEGLGVAWPGDDLALLFFGGLFLLVAALTVRSVTPMKPELVP